MVRRLAFSQLKEMVAALKYVSKTRILVAIRNPDFDRVMSKNLNIVAWIYNFALMNKYILTRINANISKKRLLIFWFWP